MILTSIFTEGPTQQDGRRYVNETHTDDAGRTYQFTWLGNEDARMVLTARAVELNILLAAQAAAQLVVHGTRLPLSKLDFRNRFSVTDQENIDAFNATYETNPALTPEQVKQIRTANINLSNADSVNLGDQQTIQGVYLYVALGLISAADAEAVLNA